MPFGFGFGFAAPGLLLPAAALLTAPTTSGALNAGFFPFGPEPAAAFWTAPTTAFTGLLVVPPEDGLDAAALARVEPFPAAIVAAIFVGLRPRAFAYFVTFDENVAFWLGESLSHCAVPTLAGFDVEAPFA